MRTPRLFLGIFALALRLPLLLLACGGSGELTGGRSSGRATAGLTTEVAEPSPTLRATARPPLVQTSPETDREALIALYNATGGPNWSGNYNWLSDVPISEWEGVTTDGNGRVIGLALLGNQLTGEIPPELGNLANLTELYLTATPQETVAPSPSAATVDGATLTITFDEPLDAGETPENSAFAVTVAAGETVTVDYTVPTGQSTNKLQDTSGNAAASFSGQAATNNTQAADPLTASVSAVPGSQSGEFTFELRFSETPRKKFSYKIMRDHAFTVTGGQVTKARRLVPRSNVGWEIHVQPDGDGDGTVTIVLPATTDCTAEGAICTQDGRKLSNRLEITVQGPAG